MQSSTLPNQLERARQILEALQQGLDPIDKGELPKTSIVNNIEVNHAIGTAVMAVDQLSTRIQRRSQLPSNVGRPWTKDEEEVVVGAFAPCQDRRQSPYEKRMRLKRRRKDKAPFREVRGLLMRHANHQRRSGAGSLAPDLSYRHHGQQNRHGHVPTKTRRTP